MTHEKKVKYFATALNICRFTIDLRHTDLMVRLYDLVLANEGKTDLKMISEVQAEHELAYPQTTET
jgi:hypothetical protein